MTTAFDFPELPQARAIVGRDSAMDALSAVMVSVSQANQILVETAQHGDPYRGLSGAGRAAWLRD